MSVRNPEMNQYEESDDDDQKEQTDGKFMAAECVTDDCQICKHAKEVQDSPHTVHLKWTESQKIWMESCPLLVNLDVADRSEFLEAIEVCRKCLHRKVSRKHSLQDCGFTIKSIKNKCVDSDCTERFSTCPEHVGLNYEKNHKVNNILKQYNLM